MFGAHAFVAMFKIAEIGCSVTSRSNPALTDLCSVHLHEEAVIEEMSLTNTPCLLGACTDLDTGFALRSVSV